jgi:hypothetical protein
LFFFLASVGFFLRERLEGNKIQSFMVFGCGMPIQTDHLM